MKNIYLFLLGIFFMLNLHAQECNAPIVTEVTANAHNSITVKWEIAGISGYRSSAQMQLWNQADFITHYSSGNSLADISALYGGGSTYGHTASNPDYWVADEFMLTSTAYISEMEFYAYQTNSNADTSSITGVYVRIYDRIPTDASLQPIWDGNSENLMVTSSWTGVYRVGQTETSHNDASRPIMRVVADISTVLAPGEYWVAVSFTGDPAFNTPYAIPRTVMYELNTGNAMQYSTSAGTWAAWEMGTSLEQQGLPFIVRGYQLADSLAHFNLYRDQQLLASSIGNMSYTDRSVAEGTEYCYKVKAVYMNGCESDFSNEMCDTTPLNSCLIRDIPHIENFDNYVSGTGTTVPCWTFWANPDVTRASVSTSQKVSPPNALYLYGSNSTNDPNRNIALMPELASDIDITTLRLLFKLRNQYTPTSSFVGIVSDPSDPENTFDTLLTIPASSALVWNSYVLNLDTYIGAGRYIAFKSSLGGAYVDDILLEYIPSCFPPQNLSVAAHSATAAQITWIAGQNNETAWNLAYREAVEIDEENEDEVVENEWIEVFNLTSPSYIINGLEILGTYSYEVKVQAICEEGEESDWIETTATITTFCDALTDLPYEQNFDDYTGSTYSTAGVVPTCWTGYASDAAVVAPHVVTGSSYAYRNTEPNAFVFLSKNNIQAIAALPAFTTPINELYIDFWTRMSNANGTLQVGYMTEPNTPSTFVSVQTIAGNTTGVRHRVFFDELSETITDAHIAFRWVGTTTTTYYCTIDDIVLDLKGSCDAAAMTIRTVLDTTVFISCHLTGSEDTWDLAYRKSSDEEWSIITVEGDTSVWVHGLQHATTYQFKVRLHCLAGDVSAWTMPVEATTECSPISTFPYYEYFDDYGTGSSAPFIPCWSKLTSSNSNVYISTSTVLSLPGSLYTSHSNSVPNFAVMPPVHDDIDIRDLQLQFRLRASGLGGYMEVGIIEDPTDRDTYWRATRIERLNLDNFDPEWLYYEVRFDDYPDTLTGKYIVMGGSSLSLDNLVLDYSWTCHRVDSIHTAIHSPTSTTFSWEFTPNAEYVMAIKPAYASDWDYYPTTNTPITVNDMHPAEEYIIRITTNCDGLEDTMQSNRFYFRTTCDSITYLPYYEYFDAYGTAGGSYPQCWGKYGTGSAFYMYQSTWHTAPASLYMSSGNNVIMAAAPPLASSIDLDDVELTFLWRTSNAAHKLTLAIAEDGNDVATADTIAIFSATAANEWMPMTIRLADYDYTGNGRSIAFISSPHGTLTSNVMYVDNLIVDLIQTCFAPDSIITSNITTEGATISWNIVGDEANWAFEYRQKNGGEWITFTNLDEPTITLDNLEDGTFYEYRVRSICGSNDQSRWSDLIPFMTVCKVTSLPYSENFDTYGTATSAFPTCWEKLTTGSATCVLSSTNNSYPRSLQLNAYSSAYYAIATSPIFSDDIEMNSLQIDFDYRLNDAAHEVHVGLITNPDSINSFEHVRTVRGAASGTWYHATVYLDLYTGDAKRIAFKSDGRADGRTNNIFIDNIVVSERPECVPAVELTTTYISSNSALISWEGSEEVTHWELYFAEAGSDLDAVTPLAIYENPYQITNLNPLTTYIYKLKTFCNSGNESAFSETASFTTLCPSIDIPYHENFDIYGVGSSAKPSCWLELTDYTSAAYISGSSHLSPPGALYLYTAANKYKMAITPEVSVPLNQLQLTLSLKASAMTYDLEIGVIEDPCDTSTYESFQRITPRTLVWNQFTVPFTTYVGDAKHIVIKIGDSEAATFYIDNIVIDYAPSCVPPTNLTVHSIDQTSAILEWPYTSGVTWQVVYGEKGFNPNVSSESFNTDQNSVEITELNPATLYDYYVKAICDGGESEWSVVCGFVTDCPDAFGIPFFENFDDYAGGNGVLPLCWTSYNSTTNRNYPKIETMSSAPSSPNIIVVWTGGSGTAMVSLPLLDENIPMDTLRVKFHGYTNSSPKDMEIGTTTDPNDPATFELLKTQTITPTWTPYSVSFKNHTGTGRYITFKTSGSVIAARLDNIEVGYRTPCATPTNIDINSIDHSSANVAWNSDGDMWAIQYRETGDTEWILLDSIMNNPYMIFGLTSNSEYEIRVMAYCTDDQEESDWSSISTFGTTCVNYTAPFFEDFDANLFPPECWTRYEGVAANVFDGTAQLTETTVGWGRTTDNHGLSSSHSIINVTGDNCNHWLVTPVINVNLTSPTLYFNLALTNHGTGDSISAINNSDDKFMVVITEGTTLITDTMIVRWDNNGSENSFNGIAATGEMIEISLTRFRNKQIRVAFYAESSQSNSNVDIHIDSIRIIEYIIPDEPGEPCDSPVDVAVAQQAGGGNPVVSWTASESAIGWVIAYKSEQDLEWTEIQCTDNCNATQYVLVDLASSTQYQLKMRFICSDSVSEWTAPLIFTTSDIEDYVLNGKLSIYPNPASEWLTYQILSDNILVDQITIFDMYGKEIQTVLSPQSNEIKVSELTAGIYFIQFETNKGLIVKKFVKL